METLTGGPTDMICDITNSLEASHVASGAQILIIDFRNKVGDDWVSFSRPQKKNICVYYLGMAFEAMDITDKE